MGDGERIRAQYTDWISLLFSLVILPYPCCHRRLAFRGGEVIMLSLDWDFMIVRNDMMYTLHLRRRAREGGFILPPLCRGIMSGASEFIVGVGGGKEEDEEEEEEEGGKWD